jgi:GNAT superfamily N-acetyltransferase
MIIEAKPKHANAACGVIRQSIEKLCIADHKNDPWILESWLRNKTPANCRLWIENVQSKFFVAILKGVAVGVALVGEKGYIYLCYMQPDSAGKGIGKQLLLACENQALAWGLKEMMVDSSYTGKTFYESQGFIKNGEPFIEDNFRSFPLIKQLKP